MTKREIKEFIEEMEAIGDEWTEEQVRSVYGSYTLEEALSDRKSSLNGFFGILGTILNGGKKKRK